MLESIYKTVVCKGGGQAYPPLCVNTRQNGPSLAVNTEDWAHTEKGFVVSAGIEEGSLEEVAPELAWKDV